MQESVYTIRASARARRLRITVKPGGAVVITAPRGVDPGYIKDFLQRKKLWLDRAVSKMKRFPVSPLRQGSVREYRARKDEALQFAQARAAHFNAHYKFSYRTITIRNQKTRWGSCSRKGVLNFNYRLLLLPPHLADYIVVHELCHLQEFNHSKGFWDLVKQTIPDAVAIRRELKGFAMEV